MGSTLNEAVVEDLLRVWFAAQDEGEAEPEIDELALLARVHAGEASAQEMKDATQLLGSSPEWAEVMVTLQDLVARGVVAPETRPRPAERAPEPAPATDDAEVVELGSRRRSPWSHAATAALAAAAAVLIVLAVPRGGEAPPGGEPAAPGATPEALGGELIPKGYIDQLHVAVQRGPNRFTVNPGDPLKTGDIIGLFYSTDSPGHLAIVHLDEQRVVTPLYPGIGKASAQIRPGDKVALPDSAVLEEGEGCEWFIAVFSDEPIALESLGNSLRQSASFTRADPACKLRASVDGARSIQVFEIKR